MNSYEGSIIYNISDWLLSRNQNSQFEQQADTNSNLDSVNLLTIGYTLDNALFNMFTVFRCHCSEPLLKGIIKA